MKLVTGPEVEASFKDRFDKLESLAQLDAIGLSITPVKDVVEQVKLFIKSAVAHED